MRLQIRHFGRPRKITWQRKAQEDVLRNVWSLRINQGWAGFFFVCFDQLDAWDRENGRLNCGLFHGPWWLPGFVPVSTGTPSAVPLQTECGSFCSCPVEALVLSSSDRKSIWTLQSMPGMASRLKFAWQFQLLDSACQELKDSKLSLGWGMRKAAIGHQYQCLSQRKKDAEWYPGSQKYSAFVIPGLDFSVNPFSLCLLNIYDVLGVGDINPLVTSQSSFHLPSLWI